MNAGKRDKCIMLMIEGSKNQNEIAEELGVTPKTISEWKKDTDFWEQYNKLLKQAIKEISGEAFKHELNIMRNSKNDNVRLKAVMDILDRSDLKPGNEVTLNGGVVFIKDDCEQ